MPVRYKQLMATRAQSTASDVRRALRQKSSPHRAKVNRWFFKCGPGEYGEGDRFLGVSVPDVRSIVRSHGALPFPEIRKLLRDPLHECRLAGAIFLVSAYERAREPRDRKRVFDFYLKERAGINNWDLVDSSSPSILGEHCVERRTLGPMLRLARSKRHWDRRMAMVATQAFTRAGNPKIAFQFAPKFLHETEDLMHKVTGWMLREAGKKDVRALRAFLARYGRKMPRTMLRYSIEKFSPQERKRILTSTI